MIITQQVCLAATAHVGSGMISFQDSKRLISGRSLPARAIFSPEGKQVGLNCPLRVKSSKMEVFQEGPEDSEVSKVE